MPKSSTRARTRPMSNCRPPAGTLMLLDQITRGDWRAAGSAKPLPGGRSQRGGDPIPWDFACSSPRPGVPRADHRPCIRAQRAARDELALDSRASRSIERLSRAYAASWCTNRIFNPRRPVSSSGSSRGGLPLAGGGATAVGGPRFGILVPPGGAARLQHRRTASLRQLCAHLALHPQLNVRRFAASVRCRAKRSRVVMARSDCARWDRCNGNCVTTSIIASAGSPLRPVAAGERSVTHSACSRPTGGDSTCDRVCRRHLLSRFRDFYRTREPELALLPVDLNTGPDSCRPSFTRVA